MAIFSDPTPEDPDLINTQLEGESVVIMRSKLLKINRHILSKGAKLTHFDEGKRKHTHGERSALKYYS